MILDQIVEDTRKRLAESKRQMSLPALEQMAKSVEAPRDFLGTLQGSDVSVIAEIKRASPSKGWLSPNLDLPATVNGYYRGGACALSVLTEPTFFKGSFDDLQMARHVVNLPVLRKDFIIDAYQVYEARSHGADAILLIAAILDISEIIALRELTHQLGMVALVETHNEQEIDKAIAAHAGIIGINNRDLTDFTVDINTTIKLRPLLPPDIMIVSESGIKSREDILRLQDAGVNAVLMGETLVTSPNPETKLRELLGKG